MIAWNRLRFRSAAILLLILVSGCATSQYKTVWKEPSYLTRPQRVMIVAVASEPVYRRMMEDEFSLQFKLHGIDAVASYTVLGDRNQDDHVAIAEMVRQFKADTLLVTRLVGQQKVRAYYFSTMSHRPFYYEKWVSYYKDGFETTNNTELANTHESVFMETNLYDVSSDKLIWAATTETGVSNLNQALMKPYIGNIMNVMVQYGLVRE